VSPISGTLRLQPLIRVATKPDHRRPKNFTLSRTLKYVVRNLSHEATMSRLAAPFGSELGKETSLGRGVSGPVAKTARSA
jgi:hypothetical protein